jgi:lysophospholipase L1-like esterase
MVIVPARETIMQRRKFLLDASAKIAGLTGSLAIGSGAVSAQAAPKDYKKDPFRQLVIMGESTVEGAGWLVRLDDRFADVLVRLINSCQEQPIQYSNKGIGANAISPRSPGYAQSRKPSALERYKRDVIDLSPDLFILCYGLNDMRAGMPVEEFRQDMATIIRDVQKACSPVTVLTTVYYMTGWKSWPPYDKGSVALTLEYNHAIRRLAAEFDCILADIWDAEGRADWLIHYDGVHANKVGNLVIAHRIFEALAQHASGLTNWTFSQDRNTKWTQATTKMRADVGDSFQKTW